MKSLRFDQVVVDANYRFEDHDGPFASLDFLRASDNYGAFSAAGEQFDLVYDAVDGEWHVMDSPEWIVKVLHPDPLVHLSMTADE